MVVLCTLTAVPLHSLLQSVPWGVQLLWWSVLTCLFPTEEEQLPHFPLVLLTNSNPAFLVFWRKCLSADLMPSVLHCAILNPILGYGNWSLSGTRQNCGFVLTTWVCSFIAPTVHPLNCLSCVVWDVTDAGIRLAVMSYQLNLKTKAKPRLSHTWSDLTVGVV